MCKWTAVPRIFHNHAYWRNLIRVIAMTRELHKLTKYETANVCRWGPEGWPRGVEGSLRMPTASGSVERCPSPAAKICRNGEWLPSWLDGTRPNKQLVKNVQLSSINSNWWVPASLPGTTLNNRSRCWGRRRRWKRRRWKTTTSVRIPPKRKQVKRLLFDWATFFLRLLSCPCCGVVVGRGVNSAT